MVFDVSLPTRGFETLHIMSDESHYGTFICGTCDKMVSLDSVVTTTCHHPHCRKCIEGASMKSFIRRKPCHCPTCNSNIEQQQQQQQQNNAPSESMQFGPVVVSVRPLPEAEPLAFQVLQRVRVACSECDWQGEYCGYLNHALLHAFNESEQEFPTVVEKDPERPHTPPAAAPMPQPVAVVEPPPAAPKAPFSVVMGPPTAPLKPSALAIVGHPPEEPKLPPVALAAAMPTPPAVAVVEEPPANDGEVFADEGRTIKEKDEAIVAIDHDPLPLNGAAPVAAAAVEMQPDLGQTELQQILVQEEKRKSKIPVPVPSFAPPPLSEQRKRALLHQDPSPQSEAMLQSAQKNACIEIPNVVQKEDPNVSDIRSFWKVRENLQQELTVSDISRQHQHQQESDLPRKQMEMTSGNSRQASFKNSSSNRNLVGSTDDANEKDDRWNDTNAGLEGWESSIEGSQPTVPTGDSERCDSENCKSETTQDSSGRKIAENEQPSLPYTKVDKCGDHFSVPTVAQRNNVAVSLSEPDPEMLNEAGTGIPEQPSLPYTKVDKCGDQFSVPTVDQRNNVAVSLSEPDPEMLNEAGTGIPEQPSLPYTKVDKCGDQFSVPTVDQHNNVAVSLFEPDPEVLNEAETGIPHRNAHEDLRSETPWSGPQSYTEVGLTHGKGQNVMNSGTINACKTPAAQQQVELSHPQHYSQNTQMQQPTYCGATKQLCQSQDRECRVTPMAEQQKPAQRQQLSYQSQCPQRFEGEPISQPIASTTFERSEKTPITEIPHARELNSKTNAAASRLLSEAQQEATDRSTAIKRQPSAGSISETQQRIGPVGRSSTGSFEQSSGSIVQNSMGQSIEPVLRGEAPLLQQSAKKADQKNEGEPPSFADVVSRAEIELKQQVDSAGDRSEHMDETQQIYNESPHNLREDMFVNPLDCDSFYESDLDIPDDDSWYEEEVVEHRVGADVVDGDDDESIEDFQVNMACEITKQNDSEDDVIGDNTAAKEQRLMNASIDSLGFSDNDLTDDCGDGIENQPKDMDASIDSLGFSEEDLNAPFDGGGGDEDDCEGGDGKAYARIVEKAEKLKKQANAKFNKSNLKTARTLYSKGIEILEPIPMLLPNEHILLSGMYANRAVTYYRQKHFQEAIDDCESAIKYNPSEDKAWIRKWRAMMALGECEEAFAFIRKGLSEVPDSKKIEQECQKSSSEMAAYTKVKALMEIGDIKQAKHVLGGVMDSSENLFLLILAARVDTALGDFESALGKINRSLKINPSYADALELRGFMHFIQGETKKASDFLLDAYNQNNENIQLKAALRRVQRTHVVYSDARAAVQDGQYKEAVDKFTAAIRESNPLPPVAPLFSMLRTERAESNFLQQQYVTALKDCQDVTSVCPKHAQAWVVRAKVLVALGKVNDAKKELDKVRRLIGTENNPIEECYQNIDFELRVGKVDGDLLAFQNELENGICSRLRPSENNRPVDPRMMSSDHSIQLSGRNLIPPDSVLPQHNRISHFDFKNSQKPANERLSESARQNHELSQSMTSSASTKDSVIDEDFPSSFGDTDFDGSSRHRGDSTRDSFKASSRGDTAAANRKDRSDRDRRRRDDRRGPSGSDQGDRRKRDDGDRRRSDDRSRPSSSREYRDRRGGYSRSGPSSRNLMSSKRGDVDRLDRRDNRREGDGRRSDDRVGTRRSDKPEEERRRSSRRSSKIDNSRYRSSDDHQSSRPNPSQEATGHSKLSPRRASMSGNGGRDVGGPRRGGSDSMNPSHSHGRQQRRSSTFA